MALKDWIKKGPDSYELKEWPHVRVFVGDFPYTLKNGRKSYGVWYEGFGNGGRGELLSGQRTKKAAHASLMKYVRTHDC